VQSAGWDIIQGYKFVTGSNLTGARKWNFSPTEIDATVPMPPEAGRSEHAAGVRTAQVRHPVRSLAHLLVALTAAAAVALATPATGSAATQSYVTIMFSRAQVEGVSSHCTPLPHSVPIWQVASDLAARGFAATEAVSTSLEGETTERCNSNGDLTLSWRDLRALRSQYGWAVVVRGNRDDRTATAAQQYADSCGLLSTFAAEGFPDASSLYAYYGGPHSAFMQSNVVSTCFAFGRIYSGSPNRLPVPGPYVVKVYSINGGRCNNTALACATAKVPRVYTLPSTLQKLVESPGWDIIQGYKFVTGANSSSGGSWNCTGVPANHWTSRGELYCYNDWQSVINAIPAASRVVMPGAIAQSEGRMGGGSGGAPTITGFSPAGGPPGTLVDIKGTGLLHTTHVGFNGVTATYTVLSDGELKAKVPAGANSGPIRVTTPSGRAASAGRFTVQ
jgi:hypothetical protein